MWPLTSCRTSLLYNHTAPTFACRDREKAELELRKQLEEEYKTEQEKVRGMLLLLLLFGSPSRGRTQLR